MGKKQKYTRKKGGGAKKPPPMTYKPKRKGKVKPTKGKDLKAYPTKKKKSSKKY